MDAIAGYDSDIEPTQKLDEHEDDIAPTQTLDSDIEPTQKVESDGDSETQLVLSRSVSPITPRTTDAQTSAHLHGVINYDLENDYHGALCTYP